MSFRILIIIVLLSGTFLPVCALMNDYAFNSNYSQYVEITAGTQLATILNLHYATYQFYVDPDSLQGSQTIKTGPGFPIGFNFQMNGYSFDRIGIHLQGWIALGQSALNPSVNMTIASTQAHYPLSSEVQILPEQLYTRIASACWYVAKSTSQLRVETIGNSPNRVCIIQWKDFQRWWSSPDDHINFQIQLHETTNQVVIHYGDSSLGSTDYFYCQVGMRGAATNDFNVRETSTENWAATTPASHNSGNCGLRETLCPQPNLRFEFTPPPDAANDLAAMTVTGKQAPLVNTQCTYSVKVRNRGSSNQSAYSVNLMNGNTQLASVNGPPISPNETIEVVIPYTPAEVGQIPLSANVVLPGDEYSVNDRSLPLALTVMMPNTSGVTIGTGGDIVMADPLHFMYFCNISETVYLASDINTTGMITAIEYYGNFRSAVGLKHTNIWLGTTMDSDLTGGWLPSGMLTQVFSGDVFYPSGSSQVIIPLTTPYAFTGGNLVVMTQHPAETEPLWYGSEEHWDGQVVDSNRVRMLYSDYLEYDPADPVPGLQSNRTPKTTLFFTIAGSPQFAITPQDYNYGQVLMDQGVRQHFNMSNTGSGTLIINSVNLSGSPYFTLQGLPALPLYLASGQSVGFECIYTPLAVGSHTGIITLTDNLSRLPHSVGLSGSCIDGTIYALPYSQGWDESIEIPFNWQVLLNGAGLVEVYNAALSEPHSAPHSVMIWNNTNPDGPFLVAPPLSSSLPLNSVRTVFWAKGTGILKVGVMDDPDQADSFSTFETIDLSLDWAEYEVGFQTYSGSGRYITFKNESIGASSVVLDDLLFTTLLTNDLDAYTISGDSTPNVGESAVYQTEVINRGTAPQSGFQVKLFTAENIEVASVTGPALAPGQTAQVSLSWTPAIAGQAAVYAKVILTGDQLPANDATPMLNLLVRPAGTVELTIGAGNETARIPFDLHYYNSLHQCLIYNTEFGNHPSGVINNLGLYNQFMQNQSIPVKIWLGTTTLSDLTTGWIATNAHSLVYEGLLNFPEGSNYLEIDLQQPFIYLNGENLVLTCERVMETTIHDQLNLFRTQTGTTQRARNAFSNAVDYDPMNPPLSGEGTLSGQFPKTTFIMISGEGGNLSGTVWGPGNQPLSGVDVSIGVEGYHTETNAQGIYAISCIWPGTYQVNFSHFGYHSQNLSVTIVEGSNTIQNLTLVPMTQVSVNGTVLASDTGTGLAGAEIALSGYTTYNATTNATGYFNIPGVFANLSYNYTITAQDFQVVSGLIVVGSSNYAMGDIILPEMAYPPTAAVAQENPGGISVTINWQVPSGESSQKTSFKIKPRKERDLIGYMVWRMSEGQENNEADWISISSEPVIEHSLEDTGWQNVPNGSYRWAVKAVYANNILSSPSLSNLLLQVIENGYISGFVRRQNNTPLQGAEVSSVGFTAITNAAGAYTLALPEGIYDVSCAASGYVSQTSAGVIVAPNQNTNLNFTMGAVSVPDEEIPAAGTRLLGSHPNPFKDSTIVGYTLKETTQIKIDIFNIKGQLVKTLLKETKEPGRGFTAWDGTDNSGEKVSSGVYYCRMTTGNYIGTSKMLLIK